MKIPIQNIYYLLCYAWNKLEEKDKVAVSIDDRTELVDLFAKILINSTRILLKRGIDRNYTEYKNEITGIRGKVAVSESLKRNLFPEGKSICVYDEFSPDILTNRVLYTTLHKLIRTKSLDRDLRNNIRQLLFMFPQVRSIEIKSSVFKQIRLNRNNIFYDFILKVCRLINENILPGEQGGTYLFCDFSRDEEKMNRLFEEFVFQFYRYKKRDFRVHREQIEWNFSTDKPDNLKYLPRMLTDITIENEKEKIIIDTKYYKETLAKHYETEKVKSANLYQLFSYLVNQQDDNEKTHRIKGILLYPTIETEYDLEYKFEYHKIQIKTVNLNAHWKKIENRLLSIV